MKKILFSIFFTFFVFVSYAQKNGEKYNIRTLAFYNLENLFDTINNPNKNDEASPIMKLKNNKSKVYWDKLNKLGSVISQIGFDKTKTSPAIIGVCEVENKKVLEDLVQTKYLKDKNYEIIHYESPDKRGIDVALLYQKKYFTPTNHQSFTPNIYKDGYRVYTRDQLLVSGYLDDELIHVIVNHWPSRRGGEKKSSYLREKAAYQNVKIIESIKNKEAKAKIFIMGDFNDNPTNASLKKVLKTKGKKKKVKKNNFYNPYEKLFKEGIGTLTYRDNIYLFDQIMFNSWALDKGKKDYSSYKMYKAKIFNKHFLTEKKGKFKGYPFRSFSYGQYTGGYSDHYPVYIYLIKEIK